MRFLPPLVSSILPLYYTLSTNLPLLFALFGGFSLFGKVFEWLPYKDNPS